MHAYHCHCHCHKKKDIEWYRPIKRVEVRKTASGVPCSVSINLSMGDLIESEYYMLIPMQHISVLRIFTILFINIQSSSYANYHARRQRAVNFPSKSERPPWLFDPPEV